MPYPVISRADARRFLLTSAEDVQVSPVAIRNVSDGPDVDWESLATELMASLSKISKTIKQDEKTISGSEFEVAAGPVIHRLLPLHPALADPEFWMWLAVLYGEEIINWRYGANADRKNFGIGGAAENLFYRLWLRAEIAYDADAEDEYELAAFGDIDFWRSHIFRQGYADARNFARALLNYQFPSDKQRKPRLKTVEIRDLAKILKRARTNVMFEIMSEARAAEFIESEWARLAAPSV